MHEVSILIIDDNQVDCYLLERELEATSFNLVISKKYNGLEAFEYFKKHQECEQPEDGYPPHVIFLDVNMPLMNGFEFLEKFSELRESPILSSTVIMMFTSSNNPKDVETALKYKFVDSYLVKGEYSIEHIEDVIRKLVV